MFKRGLSITAIVALVILTFVMMIIIIYGAQYIVDIDRGVEIKESVSERTDYEISKLDAEIRKIRSDTAGSLFWLKLIGLFVTVGGAVGGYLIGQSRMTKKKLDFEEKLTKKKLDFEVRKNVDEVYQSIIRELASDSPVLRAAAAVKLGTILKSFPSEWEVSDTRKEELVQLSKQVLAAALSIENEKKVLKTLTINIVSHKKSGVQRSNVRGLDLSGAQASDAYWAKCDFEYADFFAADLSKSSFRKSILKSAQFLKSDLQNAVLAEAECDNANFEMADLRYASFEGAILNSVNFKNAKVYSTSLKNAIIKTPYDCKVDISKAGDGSEMISVNEWVGKDGSIL